MINELKRFPMISLMVEMVKRLILSTKSILDLVSFSDYLWDQIDFIDVDLALEQDKVLIEHQCALKEAKTKDNFNGTITTNCSTKCIGETPDVVEENSPDN